MNKYLNKYYKKGIAGIIGLFIIYLAIPLPSPLFEEDYSLIVNDKDGNHLRIFLNNKEQWAFPPSEKFDVPEKLKKAVLCFEDNYFYYHPGFNPVSIARAAYQNISEGKIVSGASTITMQVARLLKNNPRTFFNKLKEIFCAFKIEVYYSKEEILKTYLDHAPFGGNVIGYKAAAERYFEKSPADLSWAEAAALAVLPNAPGMVSPGSDNITLKKKRDWLLKKLNEENIINNDTYRLAILEPVINKVYTFNNFAPHLSQNIKNAHYKNVEVNTTIDIKTQQYIEMLAKHHIDVLRNEGITNCAAVVLETKTGKVRSYVGSHDYFDVKSEGMVDGVKAWRSSGSILKPFLFALSIDDGIIIPQTLMKDVRSYFDAFSPSNADEKFNGVISAKEALIRSLNIPAVRLLNTFGVYRFYSFLKSAGVSTLFRPADDYGLPLIIGGAEVNLMDMVMLYRGLATDGKFSTPYYLKADSIKSQNYSSQLISSGASYLTLEMLKELKRPGAEYYWQQFQNQRPIAWKTGTSYGGKDAWAVGVSPEWTIGIWVGNFSGEGNPNLGGAKSAGPLMLEIFNYLYDNSDKKWFSKNEIDFKQSIICKETGFLAGQFCDSKDTVEVPVYMKPLRVCPFHKNVFVDMGNNYAVCSNCWNEGYMEKNILVYPAEINYHLKKRGKNIETYPDHNPSCQHRTDINPLQFLYPLDSVRVFLPRDFDGEIQKLVSRVAHNNPAKKLFWYLNDTYLGSTKNKHERAISLTKGWHILFVTDEDGYEDKVKFYVNVTEN